MIVFLIDVENLCTPAWIEEAFQKLEQGREGIAVRRAYGSADTLKRVAPVLLARAIRPFANLSLSKSTTDVALAVDAMELSCLTPVPTTVVIGSGDADFVPLVVRLRERGIRMVCVSEPAKMSPEALPWYDEVILVGQDQLIAELTLPSVGPDAMQQLLPAAQARAGKARVSKATAKAAPPASGRNKSSRDTASVKG